MNRRQEQRVNILVTEGSIHAFPVAGHVTGKSALRAKYQAHGLEYPSRQTYAGKGVTAASVLPAAVRDAVEPRSLVPEKPSSTAVAGPMTPVYYPHEGGGDYIGGNFTD
jgi:hypothetical protein